VLATLSFTVPVIFSFSSLISAPYAASVAHTFIAIYILVFLAQKVRFSNNSERAVNLKDQEI
jgi:hypothetical protein